MTVVNAWPATTGVPDDQRLLAAALEAFARRGYDGTSVRELTRELGVSHNFIHQRFGSKDRLWYAAVDHGFALLAADLAATPFPEGGDDLDRLRAAAVRYVESMSRRPALLRIINAEATSPSPRVDYLHDRYIEPVKAFLAELLERLVLEGRVRPTPVTYLYFVLTNGAAGPAALPALAARFGDELRTDDPELVRRHAEATVDLVFDGLVV